MDRARWLRENPEERAEVETIEIAPNKRSVFAALRRYASHPDNG
jgi:hypothetical protein